MPSCLGEGCMLVATCSPPVEVMGRLYEAPYIGMD